MSGHFQWRAKLKHSRTAQWQQQQKRIHNFLGVYAVGGDSGSNCVEVSMSMALGGIIPELRYQLQVWQPT